jgi:hypothetical protein
MSHFDKHRESVTALIDSTEAMLDSMEKYGVDPNSDKETRVHCIDPLLKIYHRWRIKYPKRANRHYQRKRSRVD